MRLYGRDGDPITASDVLSAEDFDDDREPPRPFGHQWLTYPDPDPCFEEN